MGEESEKRNFDPGMVKDSGRGKQEAKPNQGMIVSSSFGDYYGFAYEAAKQRKSGD